MPATPQHKDRLALWQWVTVTISALAYFFVYHWQFLESPWHFQEDVVQHLVWLGEGHPRSGWAADGGYARFSKLMQPLGYKTLLAGLGYFAGPVALSRWLPVTLTLATVVYGTLLFRRALGFWVALAGGLLITHYNLGESFGFLARAWNVPVLTAFAYYLVRGDRPWSVVSTLFFGALFYPPVVPLQLLVLGGWAVFHAFTWLVTATATERRRGVRTLYQRGAVNFWATLCLPVLSVLALVYFSSNATLTGLGGFFPDDVLRRMPEFGPEGRVKFSNLRDAPTMNILRYFLRRFFTLGHPSHLIWIIPMAAFGLGVYHREKLGRVTLFLVFFAAATCFMYVLAKEFMPALFLPDRYVNYPWRLLVPATLTVLVGGLTLFRPTGLTRLLAAASLLIWGFIYQSPDEVRSVEIEHLEPVFTAIAALPGDSPIAGHPDLMNFIPLFTDRAIFIGNEQAHALYFKRYYDLITPRYQDQVRAFAAPRDSLHVVLDFTDKYQLDYLLLDEKRLRNKRFPSFAPYEDQYADLTANVPADSLALLNLPPEWLTKLTDRHWLVSLPER